ncbi:MAG: outer membrane protein [Beijerinckiaceae bacterium]
MVRKLLVSGVAFAALTSGAYGANPPPVFTWTGFYVGANAGLSGNKFTDDFYLNGGYDLTQHARSNGFSGGGQVGFNYQFSNNFVVGLETDLQGSSLKGTYYAESAIFGVNEAASQVDWWGTARARVGYAFGNILPYATGGFAYGRVTNSCDLTLGPVGCQRGDYSWSSLRTGWAAGAGLEYALTGNLIFKTEYLYTDLGSWYSQDPQDAIHDPGLFQNVKTSFHTVRAGLDWKFDWLTPPAAVAPPVFVLPPPVFAWTGFYVGVNAGLSGDKFTDDYYLNGVYDPAFNAGTQRARSIGFSGGGEIGFNYQLSNNFVVGIETDLQGSTIKGTYIDDPTLAGVVGEVASQVDWWGTARARIGYAFGNILPYATGGFAYGRVTNSCDVTQTLVPTCQKGDYSWSSLRTGWTAGAGLEYAITKNLSFKTEYLYTDLGSWYSQDPQDAIRNPGLYQDVKTSFHTVRAGLDWKFD